MKKEMVGIGLVLMLFFLAPAAHANDNENAPSYKWTGVYIGGNIGGAFGHAAPKTRVAPTGIGNVYFTGNDFELIEDAGKNPFNPNSLMSGAQIGYNHQYKRLIFGLETGFDYFNLDRAHSLTREYQTAPGSFYTLQNHVTTNWLYTLQTRLGLSIGKALIYGTTGMALTRIKYHHAFVDDFTPARETASTSRVRLGWVIGAGIEYGLTKNWTIKGEYLYINFRKVSIGESALTTPVSRDQFSHSLDLDTNVIRIGINYKF